MSEHCASPAPSRRPGQETGAGLILYTDGGARGNPGPAGAGAVCYEGDPAAPSEHARKVFELKKYLGERRTNNWAEYEALILALELAAKSGCDTEGVEVRMDSELIVRQLQGVYTVKDANLKEQYRRVRALLDAHFPGARFVHVPRSENKEADRLVNEAIDERV